VGLKHQEAGKAAHPVDVGKAFQLGVARFQLPDIRYQQAATKNRMNHWRSRSAYPLRISERAARASSDYNECAMKKSRVSMAESGSSWEILTEAKVE
jgi:hypothetical protein